jgi:acetyl-CoA decarbonylase/synthase complex subunit gamma
MALTGLQIQKLLPKTNCKECGSNTCLAFAMKLASKKAELSLCPYASEEAKAVLGAASEPPVKEISLGADKALKLGAETCLYRHEKTFVNQTALAVNVNDTDSPEAATATLNAVRDYELERVGELLCIEMICVTQLGDDTAVFVELVRQAAATGKPLVVRSLRVDALLAAAEVATPGSVLASATAESAEALVAVAKTCGHALAVTGSDLNAIVAMTASIKEGGFNDLVLDYQTHSLVERVATNSIGRAEALRRNYKPLGYPSLRVIDATDPLDAMVEATTEICKYGGICVLPVFDPALLSGIMTLRQNIFTDPQKPIQVEPKLYPIGEPDENSPVFITTNFSLTYFIVSGEIENAGLSAWLVIPECEGMSVLTAWAAGKFSGDSIAKFCKEIELESKVKTRTLSIPGYVAQISGELEEAMPGWEILVGPQEAADLESYIMARYQS